MRGRNGGGNNNNNNNNNNRRGPNPLNRNYESNGPDVKIRGSAQQIAEKYATLARDAMSSGDRVMAENYLQHAEHYNRIIAAAQAQMPIQHQQQNRDEFDDDLDDEREDFEGAGNAAEAPVAAVNHGAGPQPVIEGTPAEVALNGENGNREGGRHHRDRRNGYQNGQRAENGQRNGQGERREAAEPMDAGAEQAETANEAAPAAVAPAADLNPAGIAAQVGQAEASSEEAAPRRTRRPRRSRTAGDAAGAEAAAEEASASAEG
nr:DUF4167 domain-containing protein [Mesorhizobium sp.]